MGSSRLLQKAKVTKEPTPLIPSSLVGEVGAIILNDLTVHSTAFAIQHPGRVIHRVD